MNTEIITIYCRDYHFFFFLADDVIRENLTDYGYKVERGQNFEVVFDFTIVGRNVRIIVSGGRMKHCDVCIVGWRIDSTDYSAMVKRRASRCKQQYPDAPIFVIREASLKYIPSKLKDLELAGQKVFNRKMGDELARDIGAVKYVEYSSKTGRGFKILLDEIAFAYLSKLKDEEDRERMKQATDEIRSERTKRNLFMFEKCLDVLHYF